jgi:diguanylate cyclase (GGDEF)-like protein/PAS domain S-box-containing protein
MVAKGAVMAATSRLEGFAAEQLRLAFTSAPIGIAVLSLDGRILRANPALAALTGWGEGELRGHPVTDLVHPEDRVVELDADTLADEVEERWRRRDGKVVWVHRTGAVARDTAGRPVCRVVHVEDVTERVALQEALDRHALLDPLTGLANRQYLMRRLQQALDLVERRRHEVAVIFCDLDDLHEINEAFGYEAGDRVLVEMADRIGSVLRGSDTAARIGGDEFVVLCEDLDDRVEAFGVIERLRRAVAPPILHETLRLHVTVSVGVAFSGSRAADLTRLLADADRDRRRHHPSGRGVPSR